MQHLAALYVLTASVLGVLTHCAVATIPFVICGALSAWVYLRLYQPSPTDTSQQCAAGGCELYPLMSAAICRMNGNLCATYVDVPNGSLACVVQGRQQPRVPLCNILPCAHAPCGGQSRGRRFPPPVAVGICSVWHFARHCRSIVDACRHISRSQQTAVSCSAQLSSQRTVRRQCRRQTQQM